MIYTFQKRKELNRLLREALPGYSYQEDKEGVPRMTIDRMPSEATEVRGTYELEIMAYRYWETHRQPMPVFVTPKVPGMGIDVNYVSHRSAKSLETASGYMAERRLFTMEW